MKCSIFVFFVVSCSAVFSEAAMPPGTSPYCRKSQLNHNYPGTNKECCDVEAACNQYIGPNETKWGLTNPDSEWIRRSCSCDISFYKCVTEGMDSASINAAEYYGFSVEICFQEVAGSNPRQYEFVPLMDVLHITGSVRHDRGNKPLSPWRYK